MENFSPEKADAPKKESALRKIHNTAKAMLVSKLLNKSKLNKTFAENLYANRILEEELVSADISSEGFEPELPKGSKLIYIHDTPFLQIDGRMYYVRNFAKGFDLVDSTYDFMPRPDELHPFKSKLKYQKKYNVSDASAPIEGNQFYTFTKTEDALDNWIIHNDNGRITKNRLGEDSTWWQKGQPYKAMEQRSLIKDEPSGRHLFAKQSALEASIGKPLDQHRELLGDVTTKGDVENGGITITPTSEADLPNIEGLKSFTYNPLTKTMERGIFHNPKEPRNKKKDEEKIQELKSKIIDSFS